MYLIDFLNSHPTNWREKLAAKPYCIDIKQDGDYYIFKYSLIESNLNDYLCRECRGAICRLDDNNKWICVARSLDKFGNWGESYADTKKIDWSRGVDVQEKVDGSIIRCWYDRDLWRVSTNGTIDAFKAECGDSTFGDVFYSIISKYTTIKNFFDCLETDKTYWFEMVHPAYNPIVIHYKEPAIYFLGSRWMDEEDMPEMKILPITLMTFNNWIKTPKHYHYTSLEEVLEACHKMGDDEEGYVCVSYSQMENGSFLRIKCKGDQYLILHHLRGNGPLTAQRVIELWQSDSLDDFIAYFPEHTDFVNTTIQKLTDLIEKTDIAYEIVKHEGSRKDFAIRANTYVKPVASCLFALLDKKVENAEAYYKQLKARNLAQLLDVKNIGIK